MSEELGIGTETVKRHISKIFDISGLSTSREVAAKYGYSIMTREVSEELSKLRADNKALRDALTSAQDRASRAERIADAMARRVIC
jgi:outer membrane murein-binding lipoprotein Lpp